MKNLEPMYSYPIVENDGWKNLTGALPVEMTNDYLFRALLQSDNETLKALLASVLRMDISDIESARITNEIPLGSHVDSKEFIMDVNVGLNDRANINLEMQVIKETWWSDRSLSYICRSFDNLNKGAPYDMAKPVRQVAFCDFTLFNEAPEFYAVYKVLNEKHPEVVYSDKLIITNIDLNRIDLATDEDRFYKTDEWARFFKAETWEDMKMLAEGNTTMNRAISGIWQLTDDDIIREQCRAREEWIINDNRKTEIIAEQDAEIKKKDAEIDKKDAEIEQKNAEIEQKDAEIKRLKMELAAKKGN